MFFCTYSRNRTYHTGIWSSSRQRLGHVYVLIKEKVFNATGTLMSSSLRRISNMPRFTFSFVEGVGFEPTVFLMCWFYRPVPIHHLSSPPIIKYRFPGKYIIETTSGECIYYRSKPEQYLFFVILPNTKASQVPRWSHYINLSICQRCHD